MLVPTFSYDAFWIDPLPHLRRERNGTDYSELPPERPGDRLVYTPASAELQPATMGAVPAAVLARPGRVRGDHPLCSFSAVGPLARPLVARQAPRRIWGPLDALAAAAGAVVLMGVGLDRMTFLHLAEQHAGRTPFRSWANGPDGTRLGRGAAPARPPRLPPPRPPAGPAAQLLPSHGSPCYPTYLMHIRNAPAEGSPLKWGEEGRGTG